MKLNCNHGIRFCTLLFVAVQFYGPPATYAFQAPDVRLPDGFLIEKVAGDELATNIFCMTVNSHGETVVSGPGYVKVLKDADGDGIYDTADLFADFPRSGAQGMYFDGNDLLVVGDNGLWRLPDTDGDGKTDGKRKQLLAIKTGGEHDTHAIRKGPLGGWWLLCGNGVPVMPEYYSGPNSPVKNPAQGFLMRMSPDFKTKEIYAHGFRNAYDFDFNRDGQIFVYDSDGERDVSLPWYRPTRVFQVRPGDHAGFITPSWKRPSYFFDMPQEIGALGRGSPTGVCGYQHVQFPSEFDDAIFVADWTFGRVIVFKRNPVTLEYDRGTDFAIAENDFGFAVTDLSVSRDGSLLISVGGRGTEGGVYRVRHRDTNAVVNDIPVQPFDSFGRSDWQAPADFRWADDEHWKTISNNKVDVRKRILLVQRLTEHDGPCKREQLESFAKEHFVDGKPARSDERVFAQIIRSHGRSIWSAEDFRFATDSLGFPEGVDELVGRRDLPDDIIQSLTLDPESQQPSIGAIVRILNHVEPKLVNQLAREQGTEMRLPKALVTEVTPEAKKKAIIVNLVGLGMFADRLDWSDQRMLNIIRSMQLLMGGTGQTKSTPGIFQGYTAVSPIEMRGTDEFVISSIIRDFLDGPTDLSREWGRLAAMLQLSDSKLMAKMVEQITEESNPIDDIHWLICLACARNELPDAVCRKTGEALIDLDRKLDAISANRDRNWTPRMTELVRRLFQQNEPVANQVARSEALGRSAHVYLYRNLPADLKPMALKRFVALIESDPDSVMPEQLRLLNADSTRVELVRRLAAKTHLRNAALEILAKSPDEVDRQLFISGLDSVSGNVVRASIRGLNRLGSPTNEELVMTYKAASGLGWDKKDNSLRVDLWKSTQSATGQDFGFDPKSNVPQDMAMERWNRFIQSEYTVEYRQIFPPQQESSVESTIARIGDLSGDVTRGKTAYVKFQCATCHDGGNRLGPRLEGVTKRFSQRDLVRSILDPSLQVSDRYRALLIETVDGNVYRGTMIYESVDGITLLDADGKTIRINQENIESRANSKKSLMPDRLMENATGQEWADLIEYLKSLN